MTANYYHLHNFTDMRQVASNIGVSLQPVHKLYNTEFVCQLRYTTRIRSGFPRAYASWWHTDQNSGSLAVALCSQT